MPSQSRLRPVALALVGLAALVTGCGEPDDIDAAECQRGSLECLCHRDFTCDAPLRCVDRRCVEPACPAGTHGCPCRADESCGDYDPAGPLQCLDGRCAVDDCPAGTDGCRCTGDMLCAAGLVCELRDGEPTCGPRTICPAGTHGCPCYDDETCEPGDDGAPMVCDMARCVPDTCQRGEGGCACLPGGRCALGSVCVGTICEPDTGQTLAPPDAPECFTPCRDSIRDRDGQVLRACDDEGVMAGCVGRTVCVDGSCLEAEGGVAKAAPRGCTHDAECSDVQSCVIPAGALIGRCYSVCKGDEHCRGDRVCVRRTCRLPCTTATVAVCGDDMACVLGADGVNGHCQRHAVGGTAVAPDEAPGAPVYAIWPAALDPMPESATTATPRLELSDRAPSGTLALRNPGSTEISLRIRRDDHAIYDAREIWRAAADDETLDGPDNPALPWLRLSATASAQRACDAGASDPSADPTLTLGPDEVTYLHVCHGAPDDIDRWGGRLRVDAHLGAPFDATTSLFVRFVDLSFVRGARGHWRGQAWFFSDFDDTLIDSWMREGHPDTRVPFLDADGAPVVDAAGAPVTAHVPNALVARWIAMREGRLSVDEFYAALRGLRERSWALPAVQSICPEGAVCYLADNVSGYGMYSDDADAITLPSAVHQVPFAIDLPRLVDGPSPTDDRAQRHAIGRIRTAAALHYPGDPRVEIGFGERLRRGEYSLDRLTSLDAVLQLGGRLASPDGRCAIGSLFETPWLVPGFVDGARETERAGEWKRMWCLDAATPYGPDDAVGNRSLSRANPLLDGMGIERRIELVDGALIDGRVLFAIIRERFTSPLPMLGPDAALSAYGYILLERDPAVDALEVGALPADELAILGAQAPGPSCDRALVRSIIGTPEVAGVQLSRLALGLVTGATPPDVAALTAVGHGDDEPNVAHALCVATDTFDGGPGAHDGDDNTAGVPCPTSSEVIFFTMPRDSGFDPPNDACHAAEPGCYPPQDCTFCEPSEACGLCSGGEACFIETCRARLFAESEAIRGLQLYAQSGFDAADGEVVLDGVEGRCAAQDGDLVACHDVYREAGPQPIGDLTGWRVGYVCHATGRLRDPVAEPSDPERRPGDPFDDPHYCPLGSEVTYVAWRLDGADDAPGFLACNEESGVCQDGEPCARYICADDGAIDGDLDADDLAAGRADCVRACTPGRTCDLKGDCVAELNRPAPPFETDIGWRCTERLRGTCSDDRYDLTRGKRFFRLTDAAVQTSTGRPLDALVEDAFRYETRFRNRAGTALGFTPSLCDAASSPNSYCYDAEQIRDIRARVDCAVSLYTDDYAALDANARGVLQAFLERTFSMREVRVPGLATPVTEDGFERARAKLLVMLGDEAFTEALSSRFDRAGIRQATFRGQDFEEGGIELQGVAGFEMHSLHLAVQYYDLALERFFHLGPAVNASLQGLPAGAGFISQGTAVAWFDRLLRASMRKADALAEIAERYRVMAMPGLGRRVVERASAGIHLESVLFSRVMQDLIDAADPARRPQVEQALQRAQTGWSQAMRRLGATYALLDETPRFLGIPEGFVPFPPLDPDTLDVNAFEKLLASALRKTAIAADKEVQAIDDSRAFDTSAAEFRQTLTTLRADHEQRIGAICGTFVGDDGVVYPAIARYAHLHPRARALEDPCGQMGTGSIVAALADHELYRLKVDEARQRLRNVYGTMDGLNVTMQQQCDRIAELAAWTAEVNGEIISFERVIEEIELEVDLLDRWVSLAEDWATMAQCQLPTAGTSYSPGNCYQVIASVAVVMAARIGVGARVQAQGERKIDKREAIRKLEASITQRTQLDECRALQIDTHGQITGLFAEIPVLSNLIEQQQVRVEKALGQAQSLVNQAQALQAAYAEAEALAIDVEAARNDPNVRIYRSDAVLAADRTFTAALEEVYEVTLVFEYYTGQSYAERDRLRFMRLARHGEDNLERYLAELADAFDDFEQVFGNPDLRVTIVSLRDVLAPSLIDGSGQPLTRQQRIDAFRTALAAAARTDPRGRHRVDFRLAFERVSPLTFGHKVRAIEAELIGEGIGDPLARVYLTPTGTATVRGVDEDRQLKLPARTAVLDTFFNGDRDARLDPAIYRSERLRDQPLINTDWEVVFDTQAEQVNADVPIDALEDIRFYLYYTDFTEAP